MDEDNFARRIVKYTRKSVRWKKQRKAKVKIYGASEDLSKHGIKRGWMVARDREAWRKILLGSRRFNAEDITMK